MGNFSIITEVLLMEFSSMHELQVLHAALFLLIYLAALLGNLLTCVAIITDQHLHCPLYFFLSNLSLLDIGTISITLPKYIVNSLCGIQSLSLLGCAAQMFFFILFAATEFALLVAMSCDCFVAICQPLHYGIIMIPSHCLWAAAGSWLSGLLYSAIHTGNMFCFPFSGSNVMHQIFCDVPHVLKVLASNVFNTEVELIVASSYLFLFCFAFLITSYACIFSSVLKMPSVEGCYKAISTCFPQLIILMLLLSSSIKASLRERYEKNF